jgi:hypothetical protein
MIRLMVTTIKQRVRVEAGGRVALQSAELCEGESAEVIVMVDRPDVASAGERLAALNRLRRSLELSPEAAQRWEAEIRAERAAWRVPFGGQ